MSNQLPAPLQDPIANLRNWKRYPDPSQTDPNENHINDTWLDYFTELGIQTLNSPQFATVPLSSTAQTASIATTSIAGALGGGVYRASFAARISVAASVSSSLIVTFLWTSGGISQSVSSTAMTGNTTTTHSSLSYVFDIDSGTPISYSTTWASVGTPGEYNLSITLEGLNR